jgi:hypothetical protein
MAKLKKILKKAGKAAVIGAAAYGASKMLGGKDMTITAKDKMSSARKMMTTDAAMKGGKGYKDAIMRGGKGTQQGKIGLLQRAKNFMADEIFTTNPKSTIDIGFSGGAKAGKMIKARGGKMVNLKPTKLY